MTNKLEARYIEFIRQLSERRKPVGTSGNVLVMCGLIDRAKALHDELLASGYGK